METGIKEEVVDLSTGSIIKTLRPLFNQNVPKEIQEETSKTYSAGLSRIGNPQRGLTAEQEEKWLVGEVGVSPTSQNWGQAVWDYWANFSEVIPYAGIDLECGLDERGNPLNLRHFILANLAEQDETVAKVLNIEDADMSQGYILIDTSELQKREIQLESDREKADREFIKIIDSEKASHVIKAVLIINSAQLNLPINIIVTSSVEKMRTELRKFKEKDPTKFLKDIKDEKNLEIRSTISYALHLGLMTKVPTTGQYFVGETPLGDYKEAFSTLRRDTATYSELLRNIELMEKINK